MPIYDYQCTECEAVYDVFHKVREVAEDIICPSCGSQSHKRLISAPNLAMGSKSNPMNPASPSSCSMDSGGGCCGGACGVN